MQNFAFLRFGRLRPLNPAALHFVDLSVKEHFWPRRNTMQRAFDKAEHLFKKLDSTSIFIRFFSNFLARYPLILVEEYNFSIIFYSNLGLFYFHKPVHAN